MAQELQNRGMRLIYSVLILFLAFYSRSQSFKLGTVVIDFNTGIEAYETKSTYSQGGYDTVVKRFATNSNLALGVEVGLNKRIGIGLRGKASTFYRELDKVTDNRPDIFSQDLTLLVNIHPICRKRFDFVIGSEIGLSKLFIDVNNLSNSEIAGKGGVYALYLNPRFYLGRFGFNLKTYLPYINYRNLMTEGGDPAELMLSRWKGSGFGLSVGVQVRFF